MPGEPNFCAGLLEEYDALWTFCDVHDLQIPITSNAAERPPTSPAPHS
ncbi:MAG TPA: hypothetical protein VFT22_25045 [Kofleriaceae bacterium]|nr:hypothetical protein [Kofleriaceae bacterium]